MKLQVLKVNVAAINVYRDIPRWKENYVRHIKLEEFRLMLITDLCGWVIT